MPTGIRNYLRSRRSELDEQIKPLRAKLLELQNEIYELETELAEIARAAEAVGLDEDTYMSYRVRISAHDVSVRKGTIKDFIVQVLSEQPGGLTALDLLERINKRFGTEYARTSLSPQLSRLKRDGILSRRGVVWYLVDRIRENHTEPDGFPERDLINSEVSDLDSDRGFRWSVKPTSKHSEITQGSNERPLSVPLPNLLPYDPDE